MPIKIDISLSAGGRFKPVSSRTLAESHISIGRDKECSITLDDAQKHVSRVHAELDEDGGTYRLTVVSKVNPVIINGTRHMFGACVALADGDVVTVGLYKLEVLTVALPAKPVAAPAPSAEDMTYIPSAAAAPQRPLTPPAAPRPPVPDSQAEDMTYVPPAAPRTAASPLASGLPASAEIDGEATYLPPVATRTLTEDPIPKAPAVEAPAVDELSVDELELDEEITYVRPAAEVTNPLGRATPAPTAPPVEEDFSEEMTYIRRPGAAAKVTQDKAPPPAKPPTPVEEDFSEDATYVRRPAPVEPARPVATALPVATAAPVEADPVEEVDIELDLDFDLSEEVTVYRPTPSQAPAPAAAQSPAEKPSRVSPTAPQAAPAHRESGDGADRALQAFLEGAGLAHLKVTDAEGFLRDSGVMARTALEGVMMLLLASTGVKKSFGADPADASDIGPLRTMSDPARMITHLFDPAQRTADGLDPAQILDDVCTELRVHQIALMAAMQAAVISALKSVDPSVLEEEQGASIGGLNLTRKSKLWDLSVEQHEKFRLEITENINRIFGPEVLAAYMAEVQRFRGR